MNNKILISIVVATYNAEPSVEKLIKSIVSQKTNEVELIIIDGCSKDRTLKILGLYHEFIDEIISESDNGVYDAWNKGVNLAKGEWVMFIGSDDELLPNSLSSYLTLLHNNSMDDYDYISAMNYYVDEKGKLLKVLGSGASWSKMKKGMSAAHVASLHNKENLFGRVGLYNLDYKICGDYELLMRKGKNLKSFFLEKNIARMLVGGMSFTIAAINETYAIRKAHKSVGPCYNYVLYVRDVAAYEFFKLRKLYEKNN